MYYVGFILPGPGAGGLGGRGHGAAVIGSVAQEFFDQPRIAGHEAGTQSRCIGAFREAVKHQAAAVILTSHRGGGLQQAGRWGGLLGIDFRVAFIRGNDEVMPVCEFQQGLQPGDIHHGAGRVSRAAEVEQLAA